MRLPKTALIAASLVLTLAACGSHDDGENADDFAAQLGQGKSTQDNEALARLPKAAANGKTTVRYSAPYSGLGPNGVPSNLKIGTDGRFLLQENGKTVNGTYDWLPDGRRLRLNGVSFRPIVLIAQDGSLYRMTNENVPIDDLTPDRLYTAKK